MRRSAPAGTQPSPRPTTVTFAGREYPMLWEGSGWRLRSKAKSHPVDFRTGTTRLPEAKRRAKEWLEKKADDPIVSRRGGGTLAALATVYLSTPKRTKDKVARNNIGRLRTICRIALGKELETITCREVGPDLWTAYQRAVFLKYGHPFDLVTRRRENIAINAAVRAARCLFLPALLRAYRAAGLDTWPDAGQAVMLPVPYVPPAAADDAELLRAWSALAGADKRLWLAIGLARFAGLRREEIANCRAGWIELHGGAVHIGLRDRPEEKWWTKTGKPYRARVIHPELAEYLAAALEFMAPEEFIISDSPDCDRARWFQRRLQEWLRAHGITGGKPLHRLRGLYADHIALITSDAVTARLASVRAAQQALGHTTLATTEAHYLTPDALR